MYILCSVELNPRISSDFDIWFEVVITIKFMDRYILA